MAEILNPQPTSYMLGDTRMYMMNNKPVTELTMRKRYILVNGSLWVKLGERNG